jgi:hypothetical protein
MVGLSMIKILAMVALVGISLNCHAASSVDDVLKKINNDMRNDREKAGFNPSGGVMVVPLSKINAPKSIKSQWEMDRIEQKNKGYISKYSERAKELLQLNDVIKFKYEASMKNKDKKSSIFRKNLSEIALAYDYTPVSEKHDLKSYGFVAGNTFKEGWTGIVEFFKSENTGNCAFTENNVSITHQAVKVNEDQLTYDINNKVTIATVEGNKDSGFVYQIDWYDNHFFRTLECASTTYSSATTQEVIALAKKIDT